MIDVPLPLRTFTMVPGQNIDPLFVCPLCHDSWDDPVELVPCGDIFCKQCIDAARAQHAARPMIMENFQCPLCETVVQNAKKPNRMLLNAVLSIVVECRHCHWRGTRELSAQQHKCTEAERVVVSSQSASPAASAKEVVAAAPSANRDVGSDMGASTALELPKALATPGDGPNASSSLATSPPAARNGPRRAQREIEDGYIPIGDDPPSAALRGDLGSPSADAVDTCRNHVPTETLLTSSLRLAASPPQTPSLPLMPHESSRSLHLGPQNNTLSRTCTSSGTSSSPHPQELWRRYALSQIEHDQLVGIFMMFGGSAGKLSRSQLRDLCFYLNFVQCEDDAGVVFASMDQEHKGYVSQDDFLRWLSTHQPDPSALFGLSHFEYTDALLQFRSVDPDSNGVIDANNFSTLCLKYGYALTPEQAMQHFRLCDERHSGYVSLQQFLQALKIIKASRDGDTAAPVVAAPPIAAASGTNLGSGTSQATTGPGSSSPPVHHGYRLGASASGGMAYSFPGSIESASRQVSDYLVSDAAQTLALQQAQQPQVFAQHYGASTYACLAQTPTHPSRRPSQGQPWQQQDLAHNNSVAMSAEVDRRRSEANVNSVPSKAARPPRQSGRGGRGDEECVLM
ncbi:hypothetical protein LSCM1_07443 [Leishmania martiniquensis]|uniref:Uncharacterized protein n=1 Tax=Leishmania martiniquensis TaxID=1580590 RepID=A0A836HTT7_9TRYP|nr:hypothetical protein LSCM1_07443 [Leishmania martiniquensis]